MISGILMDCVSVAHLQKSVLNLAECYNGASNVRIMPNAIFTKSWTTWQTVQLDGCGFESFLKIL